jgi:hypothetical protein
MKKRREQMATKRNIMKRSDNNESTGLTAIGSAGGWEVAIDETTSGDQRWFAQIEGPSVYLHFEIESPHVINKVLAFLTEQKKAGSGSHGTWSQRNGELVIGKSEEEPVTLVRDDEFPDRCFLVAETNMKLIVRVTIGGRDLRLLEKALRQAKEDLDGDDSD